MIVNAVAPWEGQLVWVGMPNGGQTRDGKEWKSVDFTLKYTDHRMQEKYITFNAFGVDRVNKLLSIPKGTTLRVSWEPDARRSQMSDGSEKWWASFSVFSITQVKEQIPQQGTSMPPQTPAYNPAGQTGMAQPEPAPITAVQNTQLGPTDDLPF